MNRTFREFIGQKTRESKKQLKTVKKVLERQGFKVDSFLDDEEDPYIYVYSDDKDLSFEGVRVYKIADIMAYRVQKEKDTHPYGKAYQLNLENLFNNLVAENGDEAKSGEEVIKTVGEQFRKFFKNSMEAERDLKSLEVDSDENQLSIKNTNLDYGSMIGHRQM